MSEVPASGEGGIGGLGLAYLQHRYAILFYTLLVAVVTLPLFAAFELKESLIEFFLAANLLAAVMPAGAGKGRRTLLAIITVVWLTISKHVTLAERTPNPNDYPGAKPEMLVPASVVFQKPKQRVNLNDCYQWWTYVPGANWRHHKIKRKGQAIKIALRPRAACLS